MTKVINKKAILVILTLVLTFCWLTAPVSAAEVDNGFCVNDEVSPQWGDSVSTTLLFKSIDVYAYAGYSNGEYIGASINNTHASWEGSSAGFFCYLPAEFYQGMIDLNYKNFLCHLTFDIDGTQLTRYEVLVDDEIVKVGTKNLYGEQEAVWISPRKTSTEVCVKVYANDSLRATIWGRIFLR